LFFTAVIKRVTNFEGENMRKIIWTTILTLPLLAAVSDGKTQDYAQPNDNDPGGFASEESSGTSYLGVDTRNVTSDRLSALNLKEERGVEVTLVDQDAPAGKAGLKERDVILTINGADVQSVEQLRRMIREIPPGRTVTLGVSRGGQPLTLKAELASRKGAYSYSYGTDGKEFKFEMPAMPAIPAIPPIPDMDIPSSIVVVHSSSRSGLMIENLTPQLGEFFGAKSGQGVLVRSVEKGSRAEKAGFHAGDVIVRVNGETVSDTGDFSHALNSRKENTAAVGIIRDKKEQTITLTLPERNHSMNIDESFDVPSFDADIDVDLSALNSEMARLKPEIDAYANGIKTAELKRIGPEVERQMKEYRGHEEELKRQMRDIQRQLRDGQQEPSRKLKGNGWI
jgi:serine protease Do